MVDRVTTHFRGTFFIAHIYVSNHYCFTTTNGEKKLSLQDVSVSEVTTKKQKKRVWTNQPSQPLQECISVLDRKTIIELDENFRQQNFYRLGEKQNGRFRCVPLRLGDGLLSDNLYTTVGTQK